MSNENNYYDKVLDLLVDEALEADLDEELAEYEAMEEHVFSQRHEEEMKKILCKEISNEDKKTTAKRKPRIAVYIACAILLASGLVVLGASAWGSKILNFMLDLGAPNSEFSYSDGIDNSYKDENIEFKYLPYGFVLTERYVSDNKMRYSFRHGEDYIALSISNKSGDFTSDTEDSNTEDILIGEIEGKYIEKDRRNMVLWDINNTYYTLSSNLSKDEIVKICNNIIK